MRTTSKQRKNRAAAWIFGVQAFLFSFGMVGGFYGMLKTGDPRLGLIGLFFFAITGGLLIASHYAWQESHEQ